MTPAEILIAKAADRSAVFGVVGLGYVGLPLAVELASAGYRVLGFDINEKVVDAVNAGRSHVGDVPSEMLARFTAGGGITATTDMSRMPEADVVSICVPTPLSKTRDPDVSFVMAVAKSLGKTVRAAQAIVLESTTYPGTTRELLLPRLQEHGLEVGKDFFLAFSPERVDPGNSEWRTRNTPKVLGGVTETCQRVILALYEPAFDSLVPVSSPEVAELTKLLENTFRSVNIGLANEMAIVCDKLGVDVWEVIEAAATKPFGFMKFTPGPGLGGHCIPIDPHYLAWKMRGLNYKTRFIEVAGEVNSEMPAFWVRKVVEKLNNEAKAVRGSKILVVGVAYKKNVDDVRESPALDIIRLLLQQGAAVRYHDPFVPEIRESDLSLDSVGLTAEDVHAADCVVLATDHSNLDYEMLCAESRAVVDTRNALKCGG
ncbi:MAG: nucleotide sugar dehydrogenase [Gemmatimonadetes bacterium]|nr:nucleotide sugar dehydrogenase [Gemmatimonadota bacterium]MCH8144394.1 nucleotide sugar dehydrogenase [Gemmatimonadota bacterium]MCH8935144.1 nucleotide sugar dehydrogenase [Gemmatimonadota bacterium]